ncbi:hypothetical protein SEA_NIMI13_73 [Gordonia phage Nimi13]|uniref:Uncharacterized protein n=1 Tax=Gordonia phage Nimi13 TaxID=2517933 RepID=A0A482JH02_9CAUD|nr:hypothetical protein SEA_NIMI13_73 [Gordonia phage Nimi13]
MNITTKIATALGATVAAAGIIAAPAQAVSADQYDDVRIWMCSNNGATVDIDYTNSYGNSVSKTNVRFVRGHVSQDGNVHCISNDYRVYDEYGSYIHAWVTDNDGGYVNCAIFLNGRKVSEAEDNSDYYSSAGCY